jgi:hypothetical protein
MSLGQDSFESFTVTDADGGIIPAAIWLPEVPPRGLILACHGGSGHKTSEAILAIAARALPAGFAVASIDGPVHGDRRVDRNLDPMVAKRDFREAWRAGVGRESMATNFLSLLKVLRHAPRLATVPVAYMGVSMGTAYGIPLLATDAGICAAALGLWSTTYPASEHLAEVAEKITCPVWFTLQWNDEFFDRSATMDLYEAIGSIDKRLVCYPGKHLELQGARLDDAMHFIFESLIRASSEDVAAHR